MKSEQLYDGFIPGAYPIDAYGDGGFRFADMSHRGSIVILPSGIHAWKRDEAVKPEPRSLEADFRLIFEQVKRESGEIDLLLIGTGNSVVLPPPSLREMLAEQGIRYDVMQTGAALRTYNILFEEQRRLAAALIAIEN